jgi:hypothetical protein
VSTAVRTLSLYQEDRQAEVLDPPHTTTPPKCLLEGEGSANKIAVKIRDLIINRIVSLNYPLNTPQYLWSPICYDPRLSIMEHVISKVLITMYLNLKAYTLP